MGALTLALAMVLGSATASHAVHRPPALTVRATVVENYRHIPVPRSAPRTFRTADVWLYGDSITAQSWRNLRPAGGLAVDAKGGRKSQEAVALLLRDLASFRHKPTVVVMAVGSNDWRDPTRLARSINQVHTAQLVYRFKIVWVNVYNENGRTNPALDPAPLNANIARAGSFATIADWNAYARTNVVKHRRSPWLVDGIHLNRAGAFARTNLILTAINRA
jgi:hypothetical protein